MTEVTMTNFERQEIFKIIEILKGSYEFEGEEKSSRFKVRFFKFDVETGRKILISNPSFYRKKTTTEKEVIKELESFNLPDGFSFFCEIYDYRLESSGACPD
jgi:hypothetical protein